MTRPPRLWPISLWCALAVAAALLPLAAATGAPGGGLRPSVSRARGPFRDGMWNMARRDARIRAEIAAGLRPPPPRLKAEPRGDHAGRVAPAGAGGKGDEQPFPPGDGNGPQNVGTNFAGITLQDQFTAFGRGSIPPDTMGAVGPNHFMEVINSSVAIYNRTGTRLSHVSLDSFFTVDDGGTTYPRLGAFDPRVVYDRRSGRWIASALEFGNPRATANHIILAVSTSSDPTGTYNKYVLTVGVPDSGGTTFFTDYETLGTDDNGIYSGMTIFQSTGGSRAKITAVPKAAALAGTALTQFAWDNITDMYSVPQPAHNLDAVGASGPAWFVTSSPTVFGDVHYRTLTWSGGVPTLSSTSVLSTPGYGAGLNAPANGSTTAVNTGDDRLQMATIRGNRLWTCRTIGVNSSGTAASPTRTAAEWLELNVSTTTASLVQSGRVFDTAASDPQFYFFPSIMVSGQGHAAMGFSGVRSSEFVGAYTCGRLSGDAAGTMGAVALIKSGDAAYTQNDTSGRNRWGDYSYTSLDPTDDMSIWTIQEHATATANIWGTWVAKLLAPAPALNNPAASAEAGQAGVTLGLTGSGFFDPGAGFTRPAVTLTGGATNGISNYNVTVNSPTSATVTFDIAANASTGARDVVFLNPDGQSATVVGGFTVLDASVLADPTNLTATAVSSTKINLAWTDNSSNEDGFKIEKKTGAGAFGQIVTVGPDVTTYSNAFLMPNTEYTYQVRAYRGSTNSGYAVSSPVTTPPLPADPTGLTATPVSSTRINLTWTDNATDETGYKIEKKTGAGAFGQISTAAVNATSYSNIFLMPNTEYTYRVRAYRGPDNSGYATSSPVTTPALPGAPTNLTATVVSSTRINLAWTDNATDENGFSIERKVGTAGFFVVNSVLANVTTYASVFLQPNTQYTYRVRAYRGPDRSAYATSTAVTTLPLPAAPTSVTATVFSRTRVDVTWTDVATDESGYKIERKTGTGAFVHIVSVGANVARFNNSFLSPDTQYTYRVRAYRGPDHSAYGTSNAVTTPP